MKMVDENGQAIIFRRNKPKYMMIDIDNTGITDKAYEQLKDWQKENKRQKK